jgi:hypothetical protein
MIKMPEQQLRLHLWWVNDHLSLPNCHWKTVSLPTE